jgi:hypothetical protein
MFMSNPTPERFSIWAYDALKQAQETDKSMGTTTVNVMKERVRGAADFIGVSPDATEYIIASVLEED